MVDIVDSAMLTLQVGSTAMFPNIHGTGHYRTAQPHPRMALINGSRLSQIVVDRILFKFSSGQSWNINIITRYILSCYYFGISNCA